MSNFEEKKRRLDAEIARYEHEWCLSPEERQKFIDQERERLGLPDTKVADVKRLGYKRDEHKQR